MDTQHLDRMTLDELRESLLHQMSVYIAPHTTQWGKQRASKNIIALQNAIHRRRIEQITGPIKDIVFMVGGGLRRKVRI